MHVLFQFGTGDDRDVGCEVTYHSCRQQCGAVVFAGENDDTCRGNPGAFEHAAVEHVADQVDLGQLPAIDDADVFAGVAQHFSKFAADISVSGYDNATFLLDRARDRAEAIDAVGTAGTSSRGMPMRKAIEPALNIWPTITTVVNTRIKPTVARLISKVIEKPSERKISVRGTSKRCRRRGP